jgi:hypothetical protein
MSDLHKIDNLRIKQVRERGLYLFGGDEEAFQKWLHTPDPQLDGLTPQQVVDDGRPEVIAGLIEEALQGIDD